MTFDGMTGSAIGTADLDDPTATSTAIGILRCRRR
jgi:hypothetical protein